MNPYAVEEDSIGIIRALGPREYWRDKIVFDQNAFSDVAVAFEENPLEIRTHVLRGLSRSLMYLGFGSRPYASTFWDIVRREISTESVLDIAGDGHCCEAATDAEMRDYINSFSSGRASIFRLRFEIEFGSRFFGFVCEKHVAERRFRTVIEGMRQFGFRASF